MSKDDREERGGYRLETLVIKPSQGGRGAPAARPQQINSIFLSSTVKDLSAYRQEIKDTLGTRVGALCSLSEDWIGGYQDTVQRCRENVFKSDGYIGLFAHYYGSIPPNCDQSITHMEFQWALDKRKDHGSYPIAVLMPASPSPAEIELKDAANELVRKAGLKVKEHAARLKAFHSMVTGSWHTVDFFKDTQELREKVIVIGLTWKNQTPMNVATGELEVEDTTEFIRTVTDEELGPLGRKSQLEAIDQAFNLLAAAPAEPAAAFLVTGDEEAEQTIFVPEMLRVLPLRGGRPARLSRPPLPQYDIASLTQWAGLGLGVVTDEQEVDTPAELADLIHKQLHSQQLCLVLDQTHCLAGGVIALHKNFWQPLHGRLKALRAERVVPHRLIAIFVDYTDQQDKWDGAVEKIDPDVEMADFSRLLMLPRLDPIRKPELMRWLRVMKVEDDPPGRHNEIAMKVLINPRGEQDGTPSRVYKRLRREPLWPKGVRA